MSYCMAQKVLFKHCDPAGIVFYPRYFEMMNDCVEGFFADALDHPFEALHGAGAVPTAQIETRFIAPSRHGDQLMLALSVTRVGRSSLGLSITARCDGAPRFETAAVLVNVDQDGRPTRWPDPVRGKLISQLEGQA